MNQSHVVQVQGHFVGAAALHPDGYRFIALDVRLDELDGRVWPTFPELHRQVHRAFRISRLGTDTEGLAPCSGG